MPLPSAPDEFYDRLGGLTPGDSDGFLEFLCSSHDRGWIEIFGVTDKDPRDFTAVLQEHFKAVLIEDPKKGELGQ